MTDISTNSTADIRNIVAKTQIEKDIDLESLADYIQTNYDGETEYDDKPPVGIQHTPISDDMSFFSIHSTGKIVIKGAKKPTQIQDTGNYIFAILYGAGLVDSADTYPDFEIVNIVANDRIDIDKRFNLHGVKKALSEAEQDVYQQSESYPAVQWNPEDESWSVLFFASGAMTISGCTDPDEVDEVSKIWKRIINEHL